MRYLWSISMSHSLHFTHAYETEIRSDVKFISSIISTSG